MTDEMKAKCEELFDKFRPEGFNSGECPSCSDLHIGFMGGFAAAVELMEAELLKERLTTKLRESECYEVEKQLFELQAQCDKLAEAISNFKKQADLYGGDYLPGNYIQMSEALADYEAWKGK